MSTPETQNADTQNPNGSEQQQPVDWEKRYKDTQSVFTKSQQELKAAKARLEVLESLAKPAIQLDAVAQKELDDLKFSDPDAWRSKMNALEFEAQKTHQANLSAAEQAALQQAELGRRAQLLEEFNRSHPGMELTDDVITYDVPPRITKKLEKGEISFDDFLVEVSDFLKSPKKVGDANQVLNQPNLGKVGGGENPSEGSVIKDIAANYKNIVF